MKYKKLLFLPISLLVLSGCNGGTEPTKTTNPTKVTPTSAQPTSTTVAPTSTSVVHEWSEPAYEWTTGLEYCYAERHWVDDPTHEVFETSTVVYEIVNPVSEESPNGLARFRASFESELFTDQYVEIPLKYRYHGEYPIVDIENKKVTYGMYPQSRVSDPDILAALQAKLPKQIKDPETGYYYYDGNYYVYMSAQPYDDGYSTDQHYYYNDGTEIIKYQYSFFQVEPVVWKILETGTTSYTLMADILLDSHNWAVGSNTDYLKQYGNSGLRTWLNGDFYNQIFKFDNSHIGEYNMYHYDYWWSSGGYSNYPIYGDKVGIPSYKDMQKTHWGFPSNVDSSNTRVAITSDYNRARGALVSNRDFDGSNISKCGQYYTYTAAYNWQWYVSPWGKISESGLWIDTNEYNVHTVISVRPIITYMIDVD